MQQAAGVPAFPAARVQNRPTAVPSCLVCRKRAARVLAWLVVPVRLIWSHGLRAEAEQDLSAGSAWARLKRLTLHFCQLHGQAADATGSMDSR